MRIMGVDFGESRTGVSICDKFEMLASPLTVIFEKNYDVPTETTDENGETVIVHSYHYEKCIEELGKLAEKEKAEMIVLGIPKRTDGKRGDKDDKIEYFASLLRERTGLEVALWNEVNTTVSAHRYLNETDVRGKKRKNVVDAVAAVIILESYLTYRKNMGLV